MWTDARESRSAGWGCCRRLSLGASQRRSPPVMPDSVTARDPPLNRPAQDPMVSRSTGRGSAGEFPAPLVGQRWPRPWCGWGPRRDRETGGPPAACGG